MRRPWNMMVERLLKTRGLSGEQARLRRGLVLAFPALLALAVMVPRLISPQFGLFDDGITLRTVRQFVGGDFALWDLQVGRFRPVYWAYWLIPYLLAGEEPLAFFLLNALTMAGTGILLAAVMVRLSGSSLQALVASTGFVLAGPAIENYYTLSKAEPIQAFMLASLLFFLAGWFSDRRSKRSLSAFIAVMLLAFLVAAAKETGLVLLPVSGAWLLTALAFRGDENRRSRIIPLARFFLAVVLGLGFFLSLRSISVASPLYGEGYTDRYVLSTDVILTSVLRWSGWNLRFFPYLIPLFLIHIGLLLRGNHLSTPLALGSLVWMAGWEAVYLPWTYMVGYFMLPFAMGASVYAAVVVEAGWNAVRGLKSPFRSLAGVGLLLAGAGFLIVQVNNLSIGRVQLLVDRINWEALETVAQKLPSESVLVVNIQEPNEYLDEIRVHLHDLLHRPDISVVHFSPDRQAMGEDGSLDRYYLAAQVENQPALTVRHGVIEDALADWNQDLNLFLDARTVPVAVIEGQARLADVSVPRLLCPWLTALDYCKGKGRVVDWFAMQYGWSLYYPTEFSSSRSE